MGGADPTHVGHDLGSDQSYREFLMAADHQAVRPFRWPLRIKRDIACTGEQHAEHTSGLDPSERCPNTMMDAPAECHMSAWHSPSQIDAFRVLKYCGVTVGGTPKQQDRSSRWNLNATNCRCLWHEAHVVAEWRLQTYLPDIGNGG
jgi:hypothetical protein